MCIVLWSRDRPQRAHIGAGGGVLRRCPRAKGRPQKQAASGTPTGAPDGEPSNAERRPCARPTQLAFGANVCRARGAHSRDMCSLRNRSPHALHTANVS